MADTPNTEVLARGFTFELNTGTIAVPVWTSVNHINTWNHAPSAQDADTTTFDDDGRDSHMKASRGDEFTLNGLYQVDEATGVRDAGQEACEAWGDEIGQSSRKQFRISDPATPPNVIGPYLATATVTRGGGGNNDPSTWVCAMKVSGALNP